MKRLLLPFVLLLFVSCTITYNRNAKVDFNKQDAATLTEFLKSYNVEYDPNDMMILHDFNYYAYYQQKHSLHVPYAYFFNKEGMGVVDDFKGTRCGQVISNLDKINKAKPDGTGNANDFLMPAKFLFAEPADNTNNGKGYDSYIIITWGMYAESLSKGINETSFKWYSDLKKNHPEVRVILLNLDLQKDWAMTPEQDEVMGIKKTL